MQTTLIRIMACTSLLLPINGALAFQDQTKTKESKPSSALETANEHFQKGRYEEARDAFTELLKNIDDKSAATIGLSRVQRSVGEWSKASELLAQQSKADPENARLSAELAECQFQQGQYSDAADAVLNALKNDPQQIKAKWIQAELLRESGKLEEAKAAYRLFVRYYNSLQPEDAETLMQIANGAAQYARWQSVSQIFKFIINTLCPDALAADENHWQSHYFSGQLLLEKYNRAQAIPELKRALAINPSAAEVYVALGDAAAQQHNWTEAETRVDAALKINPKLPRALQLKANVEFANGNISAAIEALNKSLAVNPNDQRALGMLTAVELLRDVKIIDDKEAEPYKQFAELIANIDAPDNVELETPTKPAKLMLRVAANSPAPGEYLTTLGEQLASRKKFAAAEIVFQRAIDVMPQLSQPKTSLGMLYMQTGRTEEASRILDQAFEADPFHVRVSNMRKVLKTLSGYHVINTEHFTIHVDSDNDRLLGEYMAEYLEEQYDILVKRFGYEPQQRTHFEIYHRAKGLSAHKWFSTRMVGLPWIQTIGASTGVIVALASPTATTPPYNWARVLTHEFVHVITLQQTHFNIPHWFTEALAVTAEGSERPQKWNELLAERVPKGEIWGLDELTQRFIRPESPLNWQFAYCQSRLCAQYMIEKYGADSTSKMLDCYRRGLSTSQAIKEVFKVDQREFEVGYRRFLNDIVAQLGPIDIRKSKKASEIEKEYQANPDDSEAVAAYAWSLLIQKKRRTAREMAEKALELNPNEPLAALTMARLEIFSRNYVSALTYLQSGLNREDPHSGILDLLCRISVYLKDYKNAETLYELGRTKYPHDLRWLRGAVLVYLRTDQLEKLEPALKLLAKHDEAHLTARKKLAEIALDRDEFQPAADYAKSAIYIDVNDASAHQMFGTALAGLKNHKRAIREFEVALTLTDENKALIQLNLAQSLAADGQTDKARKLAESLSDDKDVGDDAASLLDELKK